METPQIHAGTPNVINKRESNCMKTVYYHPWWQWPQADGPDRINPDPLDNPLFMENIFIT